MQLSQEGTLSRTGLPFKIEDMNLEAKKASCLFRAFYTGIYESGETAATYEAGFSVLLDIRLGLEKGMQQLEEEAFEAMRQEGRGQPCGRT